MKARLLFVSRKWPPAIGGMETYSVDLAESLSDHFQVTQLVLPGRPDGSPPRFGSYMWFLLRASAHVLLKGRLYDHLVLGDLILFPVGMISRVVAPRQTRAVVLYGLDLVYQRRKGFLPRIYGAYFSAFRRSQGIFRVKAAISNYTRSLADQAGITDVLLALPCLPDSELTRAAPNATFSLEDSAGKGARILYFGRLVQRKGADWFASEVLPSLPASTTFIVVGAPTDAEYSDRLKARPQVQYEGKASNIKLAALIREADIVVMPNIQSPGSDDAEGFGLVAVEAASMGAILVAARLQGITDAVIEGKTGQLVSPGDAPEWVRTINRLLQEPSTDKLRRRQLASQVCRDTFSRERLGLAFKTFLTARPEPKSEEPR